MGTRQTFSQQNISAQHSFSAQPNIYWLTLTASPHSSRPPSPPHVPQAAPARRPRPSRRRTPPSRSCRTPPPSLPPTAEGRRTPPPGHCPDANRRPSASSLQQPATPPHDARGTPPLRNVFTMLYPWVTRYPPATRRAQGRVRNFTHGHGDG
jgi:hypothetical protein